MRGSVERVPVGGVLESVVGAHVDDEDVLAELGGDGGGLPVGQRQEDDVVPTALACEDLGRGRLQGPAGERHQVRLEGAEELSGVGVAGQRADLHLGVGEQQTQDLSARVPARSGHRYTYHHRTLLLDGMTIRTAAVLCKALAVI